MLVEVVLVGAEQSSEEAEGGCEEERPTRRAGEGAEAVSVDEGRASMAVDNLDDDAHNDDDHDNGDDDHWIDPPTR